jgi:hypothetical protein
MSTGSARITVPKSELLDVNILGKFASLKQQWLSETAMLSSVTMIAMNQAYQHIIGMGPDVVPLILRDLSREPNHWFWALSAITGENPIAPEDEGDLDKMTAAWLRLGQERGWI